MAWKIEFSRAAEKAFLKLPEEIQRCVAKVIDRLAENPRPRGSKKLSAHKDLYRLRVGSCRILYAIRGDQLLVLIVEIGHRREVYRQR